MADNKHILFVSSWYPNRNDPTLGIFNRYFALAAALYNKVTVLNISSERGLNAENDIEITDEHNIQTITVYYKKVVSSYPFVSDILKRFRVLKAFDVGFLKVLERGRPDLMQLNVILPMGVGVLHLSKKYNIPFVVNENWSGYCSEDGNYKGLVQKHFTEKIVRHAKAIMPTSTYLRDAMLSHQLDGNYHVVPNVVNVNVFRPISESSHHSGTAFIHISSLNDREKNVSGLIRAFANAVKSQPDLSLKIVGEGADKAKYETMVKVLGLENKIEFLGRLFSDQLVKAINDADALVMFSHFETFCLVIIEAFACGKPVITSSAGAIKTYMKPELGIMVDVKNEAQLTEAMVKFHNNKLSFDAVKIRKYAVDHYSYEKVGRDLNSIYNQALLKDK